MIYKMEDVQPGDWITLKKGKSKSLTRGFSYQVQHDLSAQGIKGRGLTFEKTTPPKPFSGPDLHPKAGRLVDWLKNLMPEYSDLIDQYGPNNHAKELMVYINHGKDRVAMTPGKAFRRIFNNFHDMGIEALVDMYKLEFGPEELTLHRSYDAEAFSEVYRMSISKRRSGFSTTDFHKSLPNSCMQKKFSGLKYHPAFAYGSGDFEIVWAENQQGQLAGRTILLPQHNIHFPIYATSQQALNFMKDIDTSCTYDLHKKDVLARLRKEESGYYDTYLLPYFDVGYATREFLWKSDWKYGDRCLNGYTSGYVRL